MDDEQVTDMEMRETMERVGNNCGLLCEELLAYFEAPDILAAITKNINAGRKDKENCTEDDVIDLLRECLSYQREELDKPQAP